MFSWDLAGIADSTPQTETSTLAVFNNSADQEVYTFTGSGFTYDASGNPTGGVIKAFELDTFGDMTFKMTGLKLKVTDLLNYVAEDNLPSLMTKIMAGDDN